MADSRILTGFAHSANAVTGSCDANQNPTQIQQIFLVSISLKYFIRVVFASEAFFGNFEILKPFKTVAHPVPTLVIQSEPESACPTPSQRLPSHSAFARKRLSNFEMLPNRIKHQKLFSSIIRNNNQQWNAICSTISRLTAPTHWHYCQIVGINYLSKYAESLFDFRHRIE